MKSDLVRVFQTLEHSCGYYGDRLARNLVIDPLARGLPQIYGLALERGFRRSGGHVYRPQCRRCSACVAARIRVADFRPSRSQRRNRAANADLEIHVVDPVRTDENFALYRRYLDARHRGGGMDDPDTDDFERFLACHWSPTRFVELRRGGTLLAVAVTDVLPQGLSAVYTYFEPAATSRGLGTFAVLTQIELARQQQREFVYLGYWIAGHPKMDYKARFRPLEVLGPDGWAPLPPGR